MIFFLFRAAKASGIKEFPNFLSCATSVALVIAKLESPAYLDFSVSPHENVFKEIRSTVTGLQMWGDGSNKKNQLINEMGKYIFIFVSRGRVTSASFSLRAIYFCIRCRSVRWKSLKPTATHPHLHLIVFAKNGCNLLVCSDYNPPASSVCCPASPICWKCASPSVDCFPS